MNVGLAFEIVSSYGIAIAEYLEPTRLNINGWIGLSWVAVWTLLFTVVIPTRPRKALLVSLASVSAVPVVIGFMIVTRRTTFQPNFALFFFWIVFPYLLTTIMSYVGARVVYTLGKAVTEARELGSYRLVERLGAGGMGEVWRAQHRLLARPAAIKLIRISESADAAGSDDAIRRFEREAQVTAALSSPHTVQLFDFGVADDGSFYYVMELLEGLDLETLVRRHGPLPAERAIYLMRQVCHSLSEAEAHGLVHRDIKPANLFVCRVRRRIRLREGARFRNCQGHPPHDGDGNPGPYERQRTPRYPGLHRAGASAGRSADRRPCGHLCRRMRPVLSAHGTTRVLRRHAHGARRAPCLHGADATVGPIGIADFSGARPSCPRLPCQTSLRPAAVGEGALSTARGSRRRPAVDR